MNTDTTASKLSSLAFALVLASFFVTPAANADPFLIGDGVGTGITATASISNGGYPPVKSIDGSGLNTTTGVHSEGGQLCWVTSNGGMNASVWVQWDLGASYSLDSIHIWNGNYTTAMSVNEVDIYYSNVATPGDPEGAGSANWKKLSGASVNFPQATASDTGFDLETATATTFPTTPIRFLRFELNTGYNGTGYTGISEIQFFALPTGSMFSIR